MKRLQNNFTNPEQSKRLLELGVPSDSADCFINFCNKGRLEIVPLGETFRTWLAYGEKYDIYHFERYYPCWSIGRLIEIYENLMGIPFTRYNLKISLLTEVLERYWQNKKQLDFSKLED